MVKKTTICFCHQESNLSLGSCSLFYTHARARKRIFGNTRKSNLKMRALHISPIVNVFVQKASKLRLRVVTTKTPRFLPLSRVSSPAIPGPFSPPRPSLRPYLPLPSGPCRHPSLPLYTPSVFSPPGRKRAVHYLMCYRGSKLQPLSLISESAKPLATRREEN